MAKELNQLISTRVATTEVIDEMIGPMKNGSVMSISYNENGVLTIVTKFSQLD
ncbi:hypothetical protein ACJROX_20665 [Pseudalkalibacillus sp. A8]|uniref:hypothetical protein n=1 Tax=Pseudalkalibacillus sp. A8 TaxID=3382641 RepID=UPI0038B58DE7